MYMVTKRVTVAEARRDWADLLRTAQGGTPVEVTRNGEPIAAIVSIGQLREIERETISQVIARFRARVPPATLVGPDPWADVRDRSVGRDIDLE